MITGKVTTNATVINGTVSSEEITFSATVSLVNTTINGTVSEGVHYLIPQELEDRIIELEEQTIELFEDNNTLDGGYIY